MVGRLMLADPVGMDHAKERSAKVLAAFLAVGSVGLIGGCSAFRERVCERGEYAVRAIAAPKTGSTCVPNGQVPPPGYERFPPGQTPTYLDEDSP
jgi:hypothetical protein